MYLNLIQLAESFGVSERVIEGWIRDEGLPHTPDRERLLFDRAQVAEWAAKRGLAAQVGFLAPESAALGARLRIEPFLRIGGIWRDVPAADIRLVFERIATALPNASPSMRQMLAQRLRAKDGITMAPIGGGFTLPHPSTRISLGRDSGTVALLLLRDALQPDESVSDRVPINRLIFFIAPSPRAHLDLLGRLTRLVARGPFRELLAKGSTDDEIFAAVAADDAMKVGVKS